MKTAGRENPIHGVTSPRNRAPGAVDQNRSCSIKWAAKQEKLQPLELCFFLTSTFIEQTKTYDSSETDYFRVARQSGVLIGALGFADRTVGGYAVWGVNQRSEMVLTARSVTIGTGP